jgi:steroid delta-isomerase
MSNRKAKQAKTTAKKTAKKAAASTAKKSTKKAAGASSKKTTAKKAAKAKSAKPKSRAPKKTAPKPLVPSLTAAEKREIVERYVAAYNGRDTAAILALYAPRATMEDPIGLPPAVGHKAIAALYQMGFDMGVTIAPDGVPRLAGNAVAFPLIASSPSSRLEVIDVFDFGRDGKIEHMRAYWGPDNLQGDLAVRQ